MREIAFFLLLSPVPVQHRPVRQLALREHEHFHQVRLLSNSCFFPHNLINDHIYFSLFSRANAGSTNRNGTCLTSPECSQNGGTAAGTCAARFRPTQKSISHRLFQKKNENFSSSFGVCCVFTISTTGTNINRNCTYLQNPSFPAVYADTTALSYTISKCSCGIQINTLNFLRIIFF